MTQELRERVAFEFRSMAASETHNRVPYTWEQLADAAIALVLEEVAHKIEALEAALWLRAEAEETCLKAVDHVGHYNSGDRISEAKGWVRNAFTEFEEAERAALEDRT